MTSNPQLPDDLVEDYWEIVVKELRDLGLSDTDAKAAAGGYRAYMKPVEWAVYNDSTAESAKMAKLWLQHRGETAATTPGQTKPSVSVPVPATPSQFPDDFTDGYWGVVIEELCDKYRMSQEDAEFAVSLYRQHMIPACDTIYNDSTHESARMAKLRLQQHRQETKQKAKKVSTPPAKPKSPGQTKKKGHTDLAG